MIGSYPYKKWMKKDSKLLLKESQRNLGLVS